MKPSQLLRKKGWCQGTLTSATGKHCIVGAIWQTSPYAWSEIRRAVERHLGIPCPLSVWNDMPDRTVDEVISALEAIGQ